MQQVVSSNVLQTVEQVEEFVEYALQQDAVGFDIETWGDNRGVPHLNDLAWIALSTKERDAVVSFQHPVGTKVVGETRVPRKFGNGTRMYREPVYEKPPLQPDRAEVLRALEPLLFSETILKAAHGGQFDIASMAKYYGDRIIPAPVTCTITINWLVNENRKRFGMKYVTKDEYGFAYDDENVGKCVEKYPYNTVAHYAHCDSTYCYCELMRLLPEIDRQGLRRVYDLENDILRILSRIRLTGIRVDEPRLHQMKLDLEPKISDLETGIYVAAGKRFNLNSTPQKRDVLFGPKSEGGQGLKPWRLTKTAKQKKKAAEQQGREYTPEFTDWSTDGEALETFRGNPVIDALLDYQDVYKIYTTYVLGYIGDETHDCRIYEGRVYTDFVQYGTKTGRFCVSGDTLLPTSRGTFRFDDYIPQLGDTAITHTGKRQPILRKVYKGEDTMFRVSLYNGAEIKCTGGHRILTAAGWQHVRDLRPGDKVYSYDGFQEIYERSGQYSASNSSILRESEEAYNSPGSGDVGDFIPQHSRNTEGTALTGNVEKRAATSIFSIEDVRTEPYEGQIWEAAPQLSGGYFGWPRVSPGEGRRGLHSAASPCNGTSARRGKTSGMAGCASYRRGPIQQRPGQPSTGDEISAWQASLKEVEVREIASLGTMGVWDIEVEGDHSYVTHGFVHHNSSRDPNLQNIPRPDTELGKLVRGAFIADEGHKLVVADYGQIELVVLAHYLGRGKLYEGFWEGIDPHVMTAAMVLGKRPEDITKDERQKFGKSINFAVVYGAGISKVASMIGCGNQEAKAVLNKHRAEFPEIYEYKDFVLSECRRNVKDPHIRTILGRKRRVPEINWSDEDMRHFAERQVFNSLIQGSSADLLKTAMVRYDNLRADDMQLLLNVHDELVTTAPDGRIDAASEVLREAMTGKEIQALVDVPLTIDLAVADRWSDCK
jgi:DNA polymerase I-like protein with 3'-5' exonuclease and polymerase domains